MKEKFLLFLQKLKKPPRWIIVLTFVLTVIFSSCAIPFAIINFQSLSLQILTYLSYVFASLFLAYSVYLLVVFAPRIKATVTALINKTSFGKRILSQYGFRTLIFATISLVINVGYVALHVVLAFTGDAFYWFIFLAGYYTILVVLRSVIILYHKRKGKNQLSSTETMQLELKKYRTCGIILMLIPFTLAVPIAQIIMLDRAFIHAGLAIFAFSAYSFYKIIMAIYNVIKSRKHTDVTIQAVRYVSLSDALVSIFALQTAMFHEFSKGSGYGFANIITGSVVCLLTFLIGLGMVIKSYKINKAKKENKYATTRKK